MFEYIGCCCVVTGLIGRSGRVHGLDDVCDEGLRTRSDFRSTFYAHGGVVRRDCGCGSRWKDAIVRWFNGGKAAV